jgi:hypothetical protein
VPDSTLQHLARIYSENSLRNHRLTAELFKILGLFESNGIPAISFKGPLLAMSLYADLGLRQCDDLDILVRRQDVLAADRLLLARGYRPELNLSAKAKADCLDRHDQYAYRREKPAVLVDIHWELLSRNHAVPFDLSVLWKHFECSEPADRVLESLDPELLMLMLCLHGYRHRWERLCWITDISELARRQTRLNWETLLRHADESRCRRILLIGLHLANTLLDAPLPLNIVREMQKDKSVEKIGMEIAGKLFGARSSGSGLLTTTWFQLRAREQIMDRIRYCYRSMLATTVLDYLYIRLPNSLAFLYPLLRPLRLMRKYATRHLG